MRRLLLQLLLTPILTTFAIIHASVDIPPALIQNYSIVDYKASGQNWDLTISPDGILYVANNAGLLTFDGNIWSTYSLPDESVVHKVTLSNDTVFTQSETSIGYWLPNAMGELIYYPIEQLPAHVTFKELLNPVSFSLPEEIIQKKPSVIGIIDSIYFVGTFGNGAYFVDDKGSILLNVNTRIGLQDNIVHNFCVDDYKHVWIAFDNGLSKLIFNSPLRLLATRSRVGKLSDVVMDDSIMYIKTNTDYYKRTLETGEYAFPVAEEEALPYFRKKKKQRKVTIEELIKNNKNTDLVKNSDYVYPVSDSLYWFTKGNEASLILLQNNTCHLKCRILFDNYNMNLVYRGKQIFPINDSLHVASTMQGVVIINTNHVISTVSQKGLPLRFTRLEYTDNKGSHKVDINHEKISFPHNFHKISLHAGSSIYSINKYISYKIDDVSSKWSEWQKEGEIDLLQLPQGDYTIDVRQYIAVGDYPVISLNFEVLPPWYSTNWAFMIYLILICSILFLLMNRYLLKQKKKEELFRQAERQKEQQKMQQLKNQMLETELQNKKNELMIQTSHLVEKGDRLNSLLEELEEQKKTLGDRYPERLYTRMRTLIEAGMNNQSDWLAFETYFNSANQDFIERFRQKYPLITKGDLRLCCLLRMNLSTKEIASLMNISVRGAELRRYRLRKRIGLDSETNLIDFLMSF